MSLTETYCRELGVAEALLPQLVTFAERGGAPDHLLAKAREFNQRANARDNDLDELLTVVAKEAHRAAT